MEYELSNLDILLLKDVKMLHFQAMKAINMLLIKKGIFN